MSLSMFWSPKSMNPEKYFSHCDRVCIVDTHTSIYYSILQYSYATVNYPLNYEIARLQRL